MLLTALALSSCANAPEPAAPAAAPAPRGIQQQATGTALRWVACVDCEAPTAKTMPSKGGNALSGKGVPALLSQVLAKAQPVQGAAAPASSALPPQGSPAGAPVAGGTTSPDARSGKAPTVVHSSVNFGFADSTLADVDRDRLQQLKPLLASARRIRITGYTDTQGGPESNDRLASNRALAVVLYLRDGLALSGPEIIGTGRPLCCYRAPNTTEAGRAQNRRAELDIELPPDADSDALIKQHASRLSPVRTIGTAS